MGFVIAAPPDSPFSLAALDLVNQTLYQALHKIASFV